MKAYLSLYIFFYRPYLKRCQCQEDHNAKFAAKARRVL